MRTMICALIMLVSAQAFAAKDPVAQFVHDTLTQGQKILENSDSKKRLEGICRLLAQRLGNSKIADTWLGEYLFLEREMMAINQLRTMVPSIIVSKVLQNVGDRELRGQFLVKDASRDKGSNYFDVEVEITTPAGKKHNGKVVVWTRAGKKIVDVLYMDLGAVDGLGSEYQQILKEEHDKDPLSSMPVTALVQRITSEEGYTRCF